MKALSLLLIEDDLNDELLTLWSLKQKDQFDITILRDGQEALDYFSAQGPFANRNPHLLPDLVLLDLHLPRVDGWTILASLRSSEHTRSLPVIVLADSGDILGLLKMYGPNETTALPKPVRAEQIIEAFGRMVKSQVTLGS